MKYIAILYWKMRIKKKVGHIVNENKLEEYRVLIDIDNNEELSKEQLEKNLDIAKQEWKEVVKFRQKIREEEMLDKYSVVIDKENDKARS